MAGLASSLKVPSDEVPARVANLVERLKAAEKELDRARLANARAAAANAAAGAEQVGKVRLVAQRMAGGISAADLRSLVGDIRGKLGSDPAVVALIAEGDDDAVPFVVAVNPAAQDLGLSRQRPGQDARRGGQRPRRRQGRPRAGLRKRRLGHRRGAGRAACRGDPEPAELTGWARPKTVVPDRPGGDDPGRGRRLGIDVGTVRIGVATSDPDGILATPVETVRRDRTDKHVQRLARLVDELDVVEVVVGLPRTLADRTGPSALDAIARRGCTRRPHRTDPGATGRRTPDHGDRAAVAARGGSQSEGTEGDDRPGRRGRHSADLAGPAACRPGRPRGSGRCLTTGDASAPQPEAVGRPRRSMSRTERARANRNRRRRRNVHQTLAVAALIVVVIGAVFLGSRLWHGLFGVGDDYAGRRRQRRRHRGPQRRLHDGDRADPARPQGGGDRARPSSTPPRATPRSPRSSPASTRCAPRSPPSNAVARLADPQNRVGRLVIPEGRQLDDIADVKTNAVTQGIFTLISEATCVEPRRHQAVRQGRRSASRPRVRRIRRRCPSRSGRSIRSRRSATTTAASKG